MGKLYTKPSLEGKLKNLNPKKETLQFLLNYSKVLHISTKGEMQFETILN